MTDISRWLSASDTTGSDAKRVEDRVVGSRERRAREISDIAERAEVIA
jgi:hypothetical protein